MHKKKYWETPQHLILTNSALLNTKHWHSIPRFTLSPLIDTSQSMLLTQLHTTTGRSRCGGRQQRPHEASLCCAPECLVGHNIVHDLSSMCKKSVFTRLYGTCFPNNKTTSRKHTPNTVDMRQRKWQVHCIREFSQSLCWMSLDRWFVFPA